MRSLARSLVLVLGLCTASTAMSGAQEVDKVTAGGWITGTPSGARASFGVVARDPATPSGNLNFVDHGDGIHVKSESITSYTIVDATTRRIEGTASIDGMSGFTFTATLVDAGEPGTADSFALTLSSGYSASGTLQGGNVQIHALP
ncbi:MAG TPA: post-COAP-1 domain-containing protein [Planctomycetota bacterium]